MAVANNFKCLLDINNYSRGDATMQKWEYCELDFDGSVTHAWFYDEVGDYIDSSI
jgi:hypothetical protein